MHEPDFQLPSLPLVVSHFELLTFAERLFRRSRTLQELPLIIVPSVLLDSPQELWTRSFQVQAAIQTWLEQAQLDDERLRIERRLIPHTPIYIPNTPEGRQFFHLAKAISDIPLNAPILPKNQNQGLWFKTLHYYWQAKGVVLAQQLLGVIANPLREDEDSAMKARLLAQNEPLGEEDGVLTNRLSDRNLEYLRLSSQIEVACFRLLTQGENYIQQWAERNRVAYPFKTPYDLLLQLLREDFLVTWQLGPGNQEAVLSKAEQRDHLAVRIRLLKQLPWLESTGQRQDYGSTKQEYYDYLYQAGWSGYWLLALHPHQYQQQIEPLWDTYVRSLVKSKEQCVDTLDWLKGEPWYRPSSNVHHRVEGSLDLLGYIHWNQI